MLKHMQAAQALPELSGLATLEDVFRRLVRRQPAFAPADVIVQDEFTHDVIFRAPDGSALVIDAT